MNKRDPTVIYGGGTKAKQVCQELVKAGFKVAGVVDDSPSAVGRVVGPFQVQTTSQWISEHSATVGDAKVIVAVHNPYARVPEISMRLAQRGFKDVMNLVQLHREFPGELPDHYWLTNPRYYEGKSQDIDRGRSLMGDRKSLELYEAIVAFRISGDYSQLPPPSPSDQYLPADLPCPDKHVSFIDCGAYTGDTIDFMLQKGYVLEGLIALEPDEANYEALVAKHGKLDNAFFLPCAVSSRTEQKRFSSGAAASSALSTAGDAMCQCVALDSFCHNFPATFIKMDVEGAEPDAIAGAQGLIGAQRPYLAISVYHAPDHLWRIPGLIHSLDAGYRTFIRSHAHSSFDTVLYAVPQ